MGKFLIKKVFLEKSKSDINFDADGYTFSDSVNIICGQNEAGKSTLMEFIKNGFFQVKGDKKGKIFFSLPQNPEIEYRADVSGYKNCLIYNDTAKIDYEIITNNIKRNYFEQGFVINLDDLMNVKSDNEEKFINIIKDPSGDKLNSFCKKYTDFNNNFIGLDGKPKIALKTILNNISQIENEIKSLSAKENEYNETVHKIQEAKDAISLYERRLKYISVLEEFNEKNKEYESVLQQYKLALMQYNEKAATGDDYYEIIKSLGEYNANSGIKNKNIEKLEGINSRIKSELLQLNSEFGLNKTPENITDLKTDFSKVKRINELTAQKTEVNSELKAAENERNRLNDSIAELQKDYAQISDKLRTEPNIDEIKNLHARVFEGLNYYNYLQSEMLKLMTEESEAKRSIFSHKNLEIYFALIFIITTIAAVSVFVLNRVYAGTILSILALLSFLGFGIIRLFSVRKSEKDKILRNKELMNDSLAGMKNMLQPLYPSVTELDNDYFVQKAKEILNELQEKIKNIENTTIQLERIESDINNNTEKLQTNKNLSDDLKRKADNINKETEEIINSDNLGIKIEPERYAVLCELIRSVRSAAEEKCECEKEINEKISENQLIADNFNKFIKDNNIEIIITGDFAENIEKLKEYCEKNLEIKNETEKQKAVLAALDEKLKKLNEEKSAYTEFESENSEFDLLSDINTITNQKNLKTEELLKLEVIKKNLEGFEGINDKKNKRNALLNEYRTKIKEVLINKTVIELTEKAKRNFDKTQPDLVNASKYLSILTDGKYTKINLSLREISKDGDKNIKKWNELSRGTKEQLYFALRLGYASNYTIDKTTMQHNGKPDLPIIIDDAFVNFDFERTKNAFKCLGEFSKTNQVLFFTCHSDSIKRCLAEINIPYSEIML